MLSPRDISAYYQPMICFSDVIRLHDLQMGHKAAATRSYLGRGPGKRSLTNRQITGLQISQGDSTSLEVVGFLYLSAGFSALSNVRRVTKNIMLGGASTPKAAERDSKRKSGKISLHRDTNFRIFISAQSDIKIMNRSTRKDHDCSSSTIRRISLAQRRFLQREISHQSLYSASSKIISVL